MTEQSKPADSPKPATTKPPAEAPAEAPEEAKPTSSNAEFASYEEVQLDTDERPPPGRHVEQKRGEASET